MKVDSRKLDRRIRIERSSGTDDGYNETETWSELATVWAQYVPSAGREAREQLGRDALMLATFRVRWSTKLSQTSANGFRVRYPAEPDGQIWDIKSSVELGRRDLIEIVATARDGATT